MGNESGRAACPPPPKRTSHEPHGVPQRRLRHPLQNLGARKRTHTCRATSLPLRLLSGVRARTSRRRRVRLRPRAQARGAWHQHNVMHLAPATERCEGVRGTRTIASGRQRPSDAARDPQRLPEIPRGCRVSSGKAEETHRSSEKHAEAPMETARDLQRPLEGLHEKPPRGPRSSQTLPETPPETHNGLHGAFRILQRPRDASKGQ